MKPWVLITGASQGIGYELAELFAADDCPLILIARDKPRLDKIAAELSARHSVAIKVMARDLASPSAPRDIFDELERERIEVSVLVNNAAFAFRGSFTQLALASHLDLIQVNLTAVIALTHLFLKPMLARREGRILNVASTAAFLPGPYMAMYFAGKAFVHSFSLALAHELAGTGVTVTSLCPGPTETQFHARAGLRRPGSAMMDAAVVAKKGYRALMKGRPAVVPGLLNKITVGAAKILPARIMARAVANFNRDEGNARG